MKAIMVGTAEIQELFDRSRGWIEKGLMRSGHLKKNATFRWRLGHVCIAVSKYYEDMLAKEGNRERRKLADVRVARASADLMRLRDAKATAHDMVNKLAAEVASVPAICTDADVRQRATDAIAAAFKRARARIDALAA